MYLENKTYRIDISIDETYTFDSMDNKCYDFVFNPQQLTRNDFLRTLRLEITRNNDIYAIALVGTVPCSDLDCAILEKDTLIVLQNDVISIINLKTLTLEKYIPLPIDSNTFGIYTIPNGYVIYGELEINKLDLSFNKVWTFSARDIFVTCNEKDSFKITDNIIKLRDWEGWYYELDFEGKKLREFKEV